MQKNGNKIVPDGLNQTNLDTYVLKSNKDTEKIAGDSSVVHKRIDFYSATENETEKLLAAATKQVVRGDVERGYSTDPEIELRKGRVVPSQTQAYISSQQLLLKPSSAGNNRTKRTDKDQLLSPSQIKLAGHES